MNIGQKIKSRRNELGIKADELAKSIGVSPSTIFRYEKGDIEKMPASVLEKIAIKLKTSPAYLMGWTEDKGIDSSYRPKTRAAHLEGENLTEEEWDELDRYVEFLKLKRNKK